MPWVGDRLWTCTSPMDLSARLFILTICQVSLTAWLILDLNEAIPNSLLESDGFPHAMLRRVRLPDNRSDHRDFLLCVWPVPLMIGGSKGIAWCRSTPNSSREVTYCFQCEIHINFQCEIHINAALRIVRSRLDRECSLSLLLGFRHYSASFFLFSLLGLAPLPFESIRIVSVGVFRTLLEQSQSW